MALGLSISVVALGVVLRWFIGGSVAGASLASLGLVLMIAGVVGGLAALTFSVTGPAEPDSRP